jgi:hypothetical protein
MFSIHCGGQNSSAVATMMCSRMFRRLRVGERRACGLQAREYINK